MMPRVSKTRLALDLWRQYGTFNFCYRLWHAVLGRVGILERRFPTPSWDQRPLAYWCSDDVPTEPASYAQYRSRSRRRFIIEGDRLPALPADWAASAVTEAENLLAGRLRYFSGEIGELGFPFDWFLNPFTGQRVDASRHWVHRDDYEPDQGDIKFLWEPSRFGWVFALVRAYAATRDERYPEAFWKLVESWRAANPPNLGPHWQCGQECALRAMALVFGLYGLGRSPASTPVRIATLAAMLALHAERIQSNIRFAQAQMGNHGLSEAVGLYTIGTLFPEFRQAASWRSHGRKVIDWEARNHSYSDGSYVQHSFNYHRLMLDDFLWALRLAELNDDTLAHRTRHAVERHARWLYQLQDEHGGRVPNYGQNDGALILPLSSGDYLDYRPVLQAAGFQLWRRLLFEPGPWDEGLRWLFGTESNDAPRQEIARSSQAFSDGGYYTLRGRDAWAMIRCHTYRDHPHQADMLHLDLWWRGLNVLRDSGSYSYNAPEPWKNYFISTAAHNTLELGRQSQMLKARRFTWVYLIRSRTQHFQCGVNYDSFQGEHYAYRRLPSRATHRRSVLRLEDDSWLVVDDVLGFGSEQMRLCWQLLDAPFEVDGNAVRLETAAGTVQLSFLASAANFTLRVARGEHEPKAQGWNSLRYGQKLAAPTVLLETTGALPARFVTLVSLGTASQWRTSVSGSELLSGPLLEWELAESKRLLSVKIAPLATGDAPVIGSFMTAQAPARVEA